MSLKKYTKKTENELKEELIKVRKELDDLRFDVRVGQDKDYGQIVWKKKELARILTVLGQKPKKKLTKKVVGNKKEGKTTEDEKKKKETGKKKESGKTKSEKKVAKDKSNKEKKDEK